MAAAEDVVYLDEYGVGTYRIELTATDLDADGWIGDASTATASAYLTVTNQRPSVFPGGPYVIREGDLLRLSATGTDVDPGDTEALLYEWNLDSDGLYDDAVGAAPVSHGRN